MMSFVMLPEVGMVPAFCPPPHGLEGTYRPDDTISLYSVCAMGADGGMGTLSLPQRKIHG